VSSEREIDSFTATVLGLVRGIREIPADIALVVAWVFLTDVVALAPVVRETPVRAVVGLAFVLFIPGYAFTAALFPERQQDSETTDEDGIDGLERVALSLGLSIAVVPLFGLLLSVTPWGIRLGPILVSLSVFTLVCAGVGTRRRLAVPETRRFRVPYREWVSTGRRTVFDPPSRLDGVLTVLLALSVLVAMTTVGYAVLVPHEGEKFSELYLLTETDNGDLVADEYPTEFTVGEERELIVGVGNNEYEPTSYSVVVQLQRVTATNESATVLASRQLAVYQNRLGHNESWNRRHTVSPPFEGTDLRLQYLLYKGEPPSDPRDDTAYREVHLWVNVTAPDQTA